ncbi:hypothetical protein F4604DRAFT_1041131 [Suillus subluteus]|nr:hypothetical protein F4604DRAFT_1041131 [Suillus subluteus]
MIGCNLNTKSVRGCGRFRPSLDDWVYNKTESLSPRDLATSTPLAHLIAEFSVEFIRIGRWKLVDSGVQGSGRQMELLPRGVHVAKVLGGQIEHLCASLLSAFLKVEDLVNCEGQNAWYSDTNDGNKVARAMVLFVVVFGRKPAGLFRSETRVHPMVKR